MSTTPTTGTGATAKGQPIDPEALKQVAAELRHAYQQLVGGHLGDPTEFANGLIAPQIARLEKLAQQAQ